MRFPKNFVIKAENENGVPFISERNSGIRAIRRTTARATCTHAEDAVQETLMRCWIVRDRLGNIGELPAFAQQCVKNHCIDLLRQQKSRGKVVAIDSLAADHAPHAETQLIVREQHEWMMECLRQLPVGARAAIQMKGIDGLSYSEMATILGTTEAAVRSKVAKARKQLWQLYKKRK